METSKEELGFGMNGEFGGLGPAVRQVTEMEDSYVKNKYINIK